MTPARPVSEIVTDINEIGFSREDDDLRLLCDELIAAVRAERPSSVHLDRGMVEQLRRLSKHTELGTVLWTTDVCRLIDRIADAIEASLAPQTPEAAPEEQPCACSVPDFWGHEGKPLTWRCLTCGRYPPVSEQITVRFVREPRRGHSALGDRADDLTPPISPAPVEGRPDTIAILSRAVIAHKGQIDDAVRAGDQIIVRDVPALVSYISHLEADISRLTLEYRVHMRNITEGEAARKAEVARLREALKMLLDDIEAIAAVRAQDFANMKLVMRPWLDKVIGRPGTVTYAEWEDAFDAIRGDDQTLAAVRAERPSSVHLDRGMVEWLRLAAKDEFEADCRSVAVGRFQHIADAIEASLAPQAPDAEPCVTASGVCGRHGDYTRSDGGVWCPKCIGEAPVSLAPVEGRPEVEGKLEPLHPRHPYDYAGTEWMPDVCSHDEPRPMTCKICALIGVNRLRAYIERLERIVQRVTALAHYWGGDYDHDPTTVCARELLEAIQGEAEVSRLKTETEESR